MSIPIGHVNYNSIQDYQIWLHNSRDKDDRVESPFYHEHVRVSWHSTFRETLEGKTGDDGNNIIFTVNQRAHFLLYTDLIFYTPDVHSNNPNIKIAWTSNLLHNYVTLAELKFNDISVQKFDTVGADIMIQLLHRQGEGKRDQYLRDIGNLSYLTNFNSVLPSSRLSLHCPWSFSVKPSKCIPLCLSTSTIVTMKFNLQRDPAKLIRVREKRDGQIFLRSLAYNDPVKIIGINNLLSLPRLDVKYALITPKEIAWQKKIPHRELFYDTFEIYDAIKPVRHGETTEVLFQESKTHNPIRALFSVAHNITAASINNHSNYINNPYDLSSGFSAISYYTLYHSAQKIIDNVESEVFSNDETYWTCLSCPKTPGYAAIVFSSTLDRDEDVGISLSGKLTVQIDETHYPTLKSLTPSTYLFKVRALITQVFRYENNMITLPDMKKHHPDVFKNIWTHWNNFSDQESRTN